MSRPNIVTIGVRRRAQAVLEDHRALRQALRARRADVVLAERLEQVVARHPRVERGVEHRERDPRQDHVREEAGEAVGGRDVAGAARPAELPPEDVEAHQAEPEDGRRDPEEREAHRAAVDDGAALDGGEDADRRRREVSQMTAAPAIRKSVRGARATIRCSDGRLPGERVAEAGPAVLVAGEERLDELAELDVPRLGRARAGGGSASSSVRCRVLAGEAQRRVARGQEVEDDERDRDHARDDDRASRRACVRCRRSCAFLVRSRSRGGARVAPHPGRMPRYCLTDTCE